MATAKQLTVDVVTVDDSTAIEATIREDNNTGLNDTWNVVAGAWQAAPSDANAALVLTAGTGSDVGKHSATFVKLGTRIGRANVTIRRQSDHIAIGAFDVELNDGYQLDLVEAIPDASEIAAAAAAASTVSALAVDDDLTWRLHGDGNARNIVIIQDASDPVVLACDFAELTGDATIASVAAPTTSVGVTIAGQIMDFSRKKVHATFSALTPGTYTVIFSATMTDSQTIGGTCKLIVE